MSESGSGTNDLDRLDLDEVRRFLVRRWTLIVGTAGACAALALVVCLLVKPVYTATSQILLDPRKQHLFGQDAVSQDSALDSSIVDSQIPIILSTRLLAKVVTRENLVDDPEFAAPAKQGLLDRLFGMFRAARMAKVDVPSVDGVDPKLAPVIVHLFDKIDVTRIAKSYVLSISVSSRDPAKAARLADSLAQTYVEDQVDVRAKSVQQAATFFENRLGALREQVRQSESAVADFRKAHGLTTTEMDGKVTVGEQQLQSLNEELAKVSADTAEKLARYQQADRFVANGASLDTLPDVIRSPVITQLRTQQADLTRREADLSAMYGPAYPAITQIRAQRVGLMRAVTAEMKRMTTTLKNDYEVAEAREDSFRKTIATLTDLSTSDNPVGVKLRELERANLANKALFENFLNRAKLAQEQSTFEEPDARLISPALEPRTPTSPKIMLIVPLAGVVGLMLGLGIAAVLDVLRRRRVAPRAARDNAFILGHIPSIAARPGARADCVAFMNQHPASAFAEGIGELATKLASSSEADNAHAVVLVPLAAGDGATSLAQCLAVAAGKMGRRVLLIDGDRARRGLSTRFGAGAALGLTDVVFGDISASKAIVPQSGFVMLPAGQRPFDSKASSKRLRAFVTEARSRFDLILIDAPAFDTSVDALALADAVDGVAVVTCWQQLTRDSFVGAIDTLSDRPNFLGLVLNKTVAGDDQGLSLAG